MTFVGNSPEVFQNIRHKKPMSSEGLAREIRAHDIHVFASRMEACSNSLLESLQCGLPALAPNVSSNPEVLGKGGELFERAEEIPGLLNRIVERYSDYQKGIKVPSIEGTADRYLNFMRGIHEKAMNGEYRPKSLNAAKHTLMLVKLLTWRIYEKLNVLGGRAAPGVYDS
jgi:glycosyltransferase involved in cell wall biosynthesis